MDKKTILVADDDKEIVYSLTKLLEYEGYDTLKAYDGIEALDIIVSHKVDLVILDVMMPRLNGISALMKLREESRIPVIILSAKTEESDKVYGLIMGADDYVSKPYNTGELMARVKALLRRYAAWGGEEKSTANRLVNDGLALDLDTKTVIADGEEKKLTPKEYKILKLLMSNPGRVFSAEEIYERVWDESADFSVENTVMVHIRRIREKIEIDTKKPKYLKVVWGIGYKMEKYSR